MLQVECSCGHQYETLDSARHLAACPECKRPTREIPLKK
jgi:Zn finger protein HypA/HybF involved in hydrogenase expression